MVTGYAGFLGSWLTRLLLESGAKIAGVDVVKTRSPILKDLTSQIICNKADVADFEAVRRIINSFRPQIIFHLAAQAIVGEAVKEPRRTFKSNIEGTWNILEACKNKGFVRAIVAASSDKAYGSHKQLPYKEDAPLKGEYPYDVSKSCADLLSHSYFNTYGVPVCVTRCGNIFGPGDLHFSRIVPDAMRSIVRNKRFIIRSDGKFTRDYIFVKDVAMGYVLLAEKMGRLKLYGQSFNFSNENPLTVVELFKQICRVAGEYNLPPNILNKAKYEIKHQYLCARKARKILDWKPCVSLSEGLKITLDWYKEYFNVKKT